MRVMVSQSSGAAGLLHWVKSEYRLPQGPPLDKRDSRLAPVQEWIQQQYMDGRSTAIGDERTRGRIARDGRPMPSCASVSATETTGQASRVVGGQAL